MANQDDSNKTIMQRIREGLFEPHPATGEKDDFVDAIYELFNEYKEDYAEEWDRIDDNETMYQGKHWENATENAHAESKSTFPKPSTPIITSTIENIKADLSDEFPEIVCEPDAYGSEEPAKVLTKVIAQELDACGWEREYDYTTQDFLNCGWVPLEVGYDPFLNNGIGGSYIRYVVNKNFMCDPQCTNIQDGRAVFKFDRKPKDWFLQRYPDIYEFMSSDDDIVGDDHEDFDSTTESKKKDFFRVIEAWFRVYDAEKEKTGVYMVRLAGHQVLENTAEQDKKSYFEHGLYPFVIARLFPQKGSALGLGITDLFKDPQRFSDKLDQILLVNAYRASRPRLLVQKGMADIDDVMDFSKEVLEIEGTPSVVAQWAETQPLPSYIMQYIQMIRESIKDESGSNDNSRGETAASITAATAITALQDMSTKRSRMESRAINYAVRDCGAMLIDVLREKSIVPRKVPITINGKVKTVTFDNNYLKRQLGKVEVPAHFFVRIRTARQTKYSRMSHNELWLQMMQILAGTVDPVIMLEGLEMDEKENLLDNIRKAQNGGMLQLQRENMQLQQMVAQLQEQVDDYSELVSQSQQVLDSQGQPDATAMAAAEEMTDPTNMYSPPNEDTTAALQGMDASAFAGMM